MYAPITTCILAVALATALAVPTATAENRFIGIGELAEITELSPVTLRTLFNPSASPGRYPMNYERALDAWRQASADLAVEGIALRLDAQGVEVRDLIEDRTLRLALQQ